MIYEYRCILCGTHQEVHKHHTVSRIEHCPECNVPMSRVYTPCGLVFGTLSIREKEQHRSADNDLVCVGNDRKALESIKPKPAEYTLPREVLSTFEG